MLTLGSLFDGSGGFPLAGMINGIKPLWSSEIEAYPLRVTAARFPDVKQLGDVTKIDGAKIDPVDIITFGSPCQDLSVAGKQKGIHDGERSNLFFEAVRIIKEMRDEDRANGRSGIHIRPRFAVWENVPGAFSSNQGNDFCAVLEALAGVCADGLDIPRPKKWSHAGGVAGDGWSIAWRVYDAQYWGVPQRRKRIYLIADFASERAAEILFEREGVCGDSAESGAAWEGTATYAQGSAGGSGDAGSLNPWDGQARRLYAIDGAFPTLSTRDKSGQNQQGICYPATAFAWANSGEAGLAEIKDGAPLIKAAREDVAADAERGVGESRVLGVDGYNQSVTGDKSIPIRTARSDADHVGCVCYALQGNGIDRADTAGCNGAGWRTDQMYTLNTIDRPAVVYPGVARSLCARADSSPCVDRGQNVVCYGVDCRNATLDEEKTHTIQAKANGGISLNCTPSVVYDARGNGGGVQRASSLSVFENHSQDTRYNGPVEVSQTVSATFGMGGNNTPFVVEKHE